jgi:hypothetical protein
MNRELISEINRFREIVGLNLLNEKSGIPLKYFTDSADELTKGLAKNSDEFRKGLDDLSSIATKSADEIDDPFLREFKSSIDEVANSQGKSFDEVVNNKNFRDMVEKKFALKVKNNADLLSDLTKVFYSKNPGAEKLVNQKVIAGSVQSAVEKGFKDYNALKNLYYKNIDDFKTSSGDFLPDIVKREMKKIIDSEIDNLSAGNVIEKSIDDMLKKNSESIIKLAQESMKKEGKILPNPKKLTDTVLTKLKNNESNEDIIKYLSKEFGILESEYQNGLVKFLSKYAGAPINSGLKWVWNGKKNVIEFYAKGKTGKKIFITLSALSLPFLILGGYNLYKESRESESLKLWEDKFAGFDDFPQEVKNWISNQYPYLTYRDPKNAKDNPSLYIKNVSYRKDQPDPTFPATHYIIVEFGDGKKVETESTDMTFWKEVPKTPQQLEAEAKAKAEADAKSNVAATVVADITDDEKKKVLEKLGGSKEGYGTADYPYIKKTGEKTFTYEDASGNIINVTLD